MSGAEIFDVSKYLTIMKQEQVDCGFIEAFVEKQAFMVFIEELYQAIRVRELRSFGQKHPCSTKSDVQNFHQSLRYLVSHSDGSMAGCMKFTGKSLKQLRSRQNE